jgi:endonuclease-3
VQKRSGGHVVSMIRQRAEKILSALSDFYGEVKPDLDFSGVYQVAVAVVLSAQTTDRQVNGVTKILFARYPDFAALAQAEISAVETIIKSTGFYHNKAKNIVSLAREVMAQFNGTLPHTMEELLTLPGIGRKSANVILSAGFNLPGLAVDTFCGFQTGWDFVKLKILTYASARLRRSLILKTGDARICF